MQPVPVLTSIPGPAPILDLLLPQPNAAFSLVSWRVATAPGGTEMVTGVLRAIKMLHWCVNWGLSPVSLKWSGTNKKYQWHFHIVGVAYSQYCPRVLFQGSDLFFFFFFFDQSMDVVNLRFKRLFLTHTHTPIYVFHWSLCFFLDPPKFQYIAHLCAKLSYSPCNEWKNALFSTSAHFEGRRRGRACRREGGKASRGI